MVCLSAARITVGFDLHTGGSTQWYTHTHKYTNTHAKKYEKLYKLLIIVEKVETSNDTQLILYYIRDYLQKSCQKWSKAEEEKEEEEEE